MKSRDELLEAIQKTAATLPGNMFEFSQPIQLRFDELISGVRSDVAVKLFGDDMEVLNATATRIVAVMSKIPGATDVKVEQAAGLPMLTVQVDREKAARYGLNIGEVQETTATAMGGRETGTMFEGDRRFNIVVPLPESARNDLEAMKRLPISLPSSRDTNGAPNFIPLSEVASLEVAPGPNQVSRESGKRQIVISVNVRGRDIGSFVGEAQGTIEKEVRIPPAYWTTWGGQFEQLQSAITRLHIVVPPALLLVFTLLFAMFANLRDDLIVFSGILLALTAGTVAL
jgi:cobalt-zinc-cadmium resistance protein CzcA